MSRTAKSDLRRLLRASRPDDDSRRAQSHALRSHLGAWLSGRPETIIACFAAIPGEPELLPLLADLPQFRWVLPRVEGESMRFHFANPSSLVPGAFGIPEPPENSPLCPLRDIGLFLCPGMAFTRDGQRLGRGKGYYDRLLANSTPEAIRVGVCFREQVLPDLPSEPHDLAMHFLATPDAVFDCSSPA